MSSLPPPPPLGGTARLPDYSRRSPGAAHTPVRRPVAPKAQTLLQYLRSDDAAGRRRSRLPGVVAFWFGLAAAVVLLLGVGVIGLPERVAASIAAAFSVTAWAFAVVALAARMGRSPGLLGAALALVGYADFWAWVFRALGWAAPV